MIVVDILDPKFLPSLKKFKETGDFNNIPDELKEGLILLESYSGNSNYAEVLYEKFKVHNGQVLARLHYLCGNLVQAEALARSGNDIYLLCEILICRNEYDQALLLLRDAPFENLWYYYAGILYMHKGESAKAKSCLEKAIVHFSKDNQFLPRLMVLSSLANTYIQCGEISKASRIFSELILLAKNIDKKQFPRLTSKLFIDIGFFLMRTGQLFKAFYYLKRAEKLVGENRSEEFFRLKVFLGYVLKQMGYYQKAIDVLQKHIPSVNYLKLDRLRYLAECYAKLGDFNKSNQLVLEGQRNSGSDKYAKIFFKLCLYENQILQGHHPDAEQIFEQINRLCLEMKDHTVLTFALGKKAYLTKDYHLSTQIYDELQHQGFAVESSEVHLAITDRSIKEGNYINALSLIERFDFSYFPIQKLESLILKTVCFINLGQKQRTTAALTEAKSIVKERNLLLPTAMIRLLEIAACTEVFSLPSIYSQYLESVRLLNSVQLKQLETFKKLLALDRIEIKIQHEITAVDQIHLSEILSAPKQIVLDLSGQTVSLDGKTTNKFVEFPVQWNLLCALTTNLQPLTKEMIVKLVLGRQNYDPLSDDNNVNVTVHRLRANLKKFFGIDPIVTKNGAYLIAEKIKVIVLEWNNHKTEVKVS